MGEHLLVTHDECHLRPHRLEHVHELHARHTRTDHDDVLRHDPWRVGVTGREHAFAIDRRPLGNPRTAAGREHHHVGVKGPLGTVGQGRDDRMSIDHPAKTVDQLHSLTVEETANRGFEARLDVLETVAPLVEIDVQADVDESHPRRPAQELTGVASGDHRLRRDAIPQMSGTADRVALDYDHVRP